MADQVEDWRITEGPAFGVESEFELSDIRLGANFYVTGSMSRRITARLTATTPTLIESLGRTLQDLCGCLRIVDEHPERTVCSCATENPWTSALRAASWDSSARIATSSIYTCPRDQFARLLPMFAHPPATARLRIEVERTLDQGVFEPDVHFWNDRLSPVIPFNEFEIRFPGRDGGYP